MNYVNCVGVQKLYNDSINQAVSESESSQRVDTLAQKEPAGPQAEKPAMYQALAKEARLWICLSQRSVNRSSPQSLSFPFTQASQYFE